MRAASQHTVDTASLSYIRNESVMWLFALCLIRRDPSTAPQYLSPGVSMPGLLLSNYTRGKMKEIILLL